MNFSKRKQVKLGFREGVRYLLTTIWLMRAFLVILSVVVSNIASTPKVYAYAIEEPKPIEFATEITEAVVQQTQPIVTTKVMVTTQTVVTSTTVTTTVTTSSKVTNTTSTENETEIKKDFSEEYVEDEVITSYEEPEILEEENYEEQPAPADENQPEYKSDEYLLAYAMAREAADFVDAEYVGSVILNRVYDPDFPNTIIDVLEDNRICKQYGWAYGSYPSEYIYDDYFYTIAKKLLNEGSSLPPGVVFQSQYILGEIYLQYGVHYYCYK